MSRDPVLPLTALLIYVRHLNHSDVAALDTRRLPVKDAEVACLAPGAGLQVYHLFHPSGMSTSRTVAERCEVDSG